MAFVFCPECGAKIMDAKARFCAECGLEFAKIKVNTDDNESLSSVPDDVVSKDLKDNVVENVLNADVVKNEQEPDVDKVKSTTNADNEELSKNIKKEEIPNDIIKKESPTIIISDIAKPISEIQTQKVDSVKQASALYKEGVALSRSEDFNERRKGIDLLEQASDLQSADAMVALGWIYELGKQEKNPSPDYVRARELYEKASTLGNTEALWLLGQLYLNGRGVTQNQEKAVEYFTRAANEGNEPIAWLNLGVYYESLGQFDAAISNYRSAVKAEEIPLAVEGLARSIINYYNTLYSKLECLYFNIDDAKAQRKIAKAISSYAAEASKEYVIFSVDDTVFGSADVGCVATTKTIYIRNNSGDVIRLPWLKVDIVDIEKGSTNDSIILHTKDGQRVTIAATCMMEKDTVRLAELLRKIKADIS